MTGIGAPGYHAPLLVVAVALPLHRHPRVLERLACSQPLQIPVVGIEAPPELSRVADMAVPRHHPAHVRYGRKPLDAGQVVTERVICDGVQDRDLDVGEHVARDQHAGVGDEHRAVPGRVPVVDSQLGSTATPRR
jgi:hypothetical protein